MRAPVDLAADTRPKPLELVDITPPAAPQRARRAAKFVQPGERANRYSLPSALDSASPIGFRTRVALTREEASEALLLLSLERPERFETNPAAVREAELFEESTLGILAARQSTNYRGHRQVTFGPDDSKKIAEILRGLEGLDAPVLDGGTHTHIVLSRPYRTPFTLLLTLVGHQPVTSPFTVAKRIWEKKVKHANDIPTIGYLQDLHLGILADAMERAAVIASGGRRRAQVFQRPFCGRFRASNEKAIDQLSELCGLTLRDRLTGWRIAIVSQVGEVRERLPVKPTTYRKLGANFVSFRSERIQPGVNHEPTAPEQYKLRQDMDVPDRLTDMAGRAGYNAFAHWTGVPRDRAKELLLLDRIDVLTPNGKTRLRAIRDHLEDVTNKVVKFLPIWVDLPTGRAFSRNAERGRKAFALTGQRIYIGGLPRKEIEKEGIDWELAVRAMGASASRGALYAEICGVTGLPADCDLLAGTCLMAGPVNQNDIGKTYYGAPDLLEETFPGREPTALLVWTLKAKTVTDPIGNEEQLLNPKRKGALVDLRPGPHEVVSVAKDGALLPLRSRGGRTNRERAFSDLDNFATDPSGRGIPGNRGEEWPTAWRNEAVWSQGGGRG